MCPYLTTINNYNIDNLYYCMYPNKIYLKLPSLQKPKQCYYCTHINAKILNLPVSDVAMYLCVVLVGLS